MRLITAQPIGAVNVSFLTSAPSRALMGLQAKSPHLPTKDLTGKSPSNEGDLEFGVRRAARRR